MHISVWKYIINIVYLHVSASHVAILREVPYKGYYKSLWSIAELWKISF